MPAARLSTEKRELVLRALSEGTPINACCRMFAVGKHAVLRVIRETGEALGDYMDKRFCRLACKRVALDEAWSYCGKHGSRMTQPEPGKGDYWLFAGIDCDSKLLFAHRVGRRSMNDGVYFVQDVSQRILPGAQIATDGLHAYTLAIPHFFQDYYTTYGTEIKRFVDEFDPAQFPKRRTLGVPKIAKATRTARMGNPNLSTLSTSAVERVFLTVRQELTRFTRLTLGYSKDAEMHRLAVALQIGVYNFVRRHSGIGNLTPAQAHGLESRRWTMRDVVELTERHVEEKETEAFEAAFATKYNC